ncbi:TerC family protein [Pectinatus frisingensis]|uniref:TerC family protein n=1 Tax=Pectinatus frisingensis TaxID=865 RepID=UPI001E48EEEC|nr:TerC family protein [Pectinatus frisingensis]
MAGIFSLDWFAALGGILILDLILSGDNAILIALACKNLNAEDRFKAMLIGCAGAIIIRVVFTVFATELLTVPYLQFIGGIALFYIALKLLFDDKAQHGKQASTTFLGAVKTIMVADFVMSLDNVLSMAGVANTVPDEKWSLILCGLLISMPIIIGGAQLLLLIMKRFPAIIYLGSGILAFTAAKMMLMDKALGIYLLLIGGWLEVIFVAVVAVLGIVKMKKRI